jgi:hypothetical protein
MSEDPTNVIFLRRAPRPERPARRERPRQSIQGGGLWERRRQVRKPALWVGKLTTPTGTHDCRVLNLSQSGARIELATTVEMFVPVTLMLELLGAFIGSVRWRRDHCIGIVINERRFPTTRSRTFMPRALRLP